MTTGGSTASATSSSVKEPFVAEAMTNVLAHGAEDNRVGISPRARKLARQKQVDWRQLAGSGPNGRIIERDVQAALDKQPFVDPAGEIDVGSRGVPSAGAGVSGQWTGFGRVICNRSLLFQTRQTSPYRWPISPMR